MKQKQSEEFASRLRKNAGEDQDVEGHALTRATPDGLTLKAAVKNTADDEDVEGHSSMRATPDGAAAKAATRSAGEDEDVEGHFGRIQSPKSRGE